VQKYKCKPFIVKVTVGYSLCKKHYCRGSFATFLCAFLLCLWMGGLIHCTHTHTVSQCAAAPHRCVSLSEGAMSHTGVLHPSRNIHR